MKKDVLNETIKNIGIASGDVIKITNECGVDYYQYNGVDFEYLSTTEEDVVMGDDEIYDLITGTTNFEIIAKGHNRQLDIEENVEDIKNFSSETYLKLTNYIKTQEEKEAKQKKVDAIVGIIAYGFITILAIIATLV